MINRIRAGMVCLDDEKILCIKQRDPKSGHEFWSLPGGGIEVAETAFLVQLEGPGPVTADNGGIVWDIRTNQP